MSPDNIPGQLDLSSLVASDIPTDGHVLPNHHAGTERSHEGTEAQRQTVRERLMGATRRDNGSAKPRNVKPAKPRKQIANVPGQFIEPLTNFYNGMAFAMMPFKPVVAVALLSPSAEPTEANPEPLTVAENCAKAWDEAAQRSESVRRFLDGMVGVSVWSQLLAAHAPLIGALMEGTSIAEKFNPAAAMEAMLKRRAEQGQPE